MLSKKVLNEFADVLIHLKSESDISGNNWQDEANRTHFKKSSTFLERDGFTFDGKIVSVIGQIEIDQLENSINLLSKSEFREFTDRIKVSIESDQSITIGSATNSY